MAPVIILDQFYLAITLLVTVLYQLLGFVIAWTFKFDKITDFTGGSNFFILALMTLLLGQTFCARNLLASIFVMVWAVRLASFLLFRVLKRGSDARFDDIRNHFWKFLCTSPSSPFPFGVLMAIAFLEGFWIAQILWIWTVSLPVIILNSPAVSGASGDVCSRPTFGGRDVAGIVIFSLGWSLETTADLQKYLWKASKPPKDAIMNTGLWKWSRHPPYFAEILCWWGIWVLCISPAISPDSNLGLSARAALYSSIVSPLLTMLILLFGSGIPLAEKAQARTFYFLGREETGTTASLADGLQPGMSWQKYQSYLGSTSILFPIPPIIYRSLPKIVKSTVLLDLKMYRTFETEEGEQQADLL